MTTRKVSRRTRSRSPTRRRKTTKTGATRKLSRWQLHVRTVAKDHHGKKFGKGGLFRLAKQTYHK